MKRILTTLAMVSTLFIGCDNSTEPAPANSVKKTVLDNTHLLGNWEVITYSSVDFDWLYNGDRSIKFTLNGDGDAVVYDNSLGTFLKTAYLYTGTFKATTEYPVSTTADNVFVKHSKDEDWVLDSEEKNSLASTLRGLEFAVVRNDSLIVDLYPNEDNYYKFIARSISEDITKMVPTN